MADFGRTLPPLATLEAFEAAFRHENFSRAADELFQSQATVSRRVRELEADLGVTLFERHRYHVAPTPDAVALVGSVRLALSELSVAAERIRRNSAASTSLTVLTSMSLASDVVAPVLGELQQRYPDLNIRVVSSCESIETTREDFDVAIQYGSAVSERFDVEYVADEPVFPVCSPEIAAQLPDSVSLDDLGSMPLLDVDYGDSGWTRWSDVLGADRASGRVVVTSYELSLHLAEQGSGIALGWERSVASRLAAGTLVRVPGLPVLTTARINAYVNPAVRGSEPVAAVVGLLLDGSA